ncbi:MAG: prolipoprotein diacylglyceryl transferase [Streptococcaceae bacterium]|jgi:phosphatidylglycerol:prolipoprotein diacylglycerol transferase|nr:prolipoprotein diacylglyceryl transferase [Streptococcaceae bacterium]
MISFHDILYVSPAAISKIALQLGPFAIHWYAILIVIGAVLAVIVAMREAPRKGLTGDDVIDLLLWAFVPALIVTRAYYVAFQWDYYSQNPSQIIAIWDGGGAIYGTIIGGAIVLVIFCRVRHINILDMLDIVMPGVLLAQGIGRWGNFINQEAYGGAVSNLNWLPSFLRNQMYIDGSYHLPTFLFESIPDLVGAILIIAFRHKLKLRRGEVFAFYLIWYGITRFIVEGMRDDSLMFLGARVSQVLSGVLVVIGVLYIGYQRLTQDPEKLAQKEQK